jgi:hypothetical protein
MGFWCQGSWIYEVNEAETAGAYNGSWKLFAQGPPVQTLQDQMNLE